MLPIRYPIYSIAILRSRYHFLHWRLKKPGLREVKSVPKDTIVCVRLNQERNLGSVLALLYPMPLHAWSHVSEELTVKVCGIQQSLKGETMKHRPSRGCSYSENAAWPFEAMVLFPWAPNNTLKCGFQHIQSLLHPHPKLFIPTHFMPPIPACSRPPQPLILW